MSFWKNLFRLGATIAIPQVAMPIANSLATLTGYGAIATRAGDIATSALLGGLTGRATGGDWRTGALAGGLGSAAFGPARMQGREGVAGLPGIFDYFRGDTAGAAVPKVAATPAPVAPPVATAAPAAVAAAPATGAAGLSFPGALREAVSQVPDIIAKDLTDPKKLAEMTLRAGGMLAGSALAGSGLTPEETRLLQQQTEELRNLQQTNQQLFQQRLQQAQDLLGEARYFDPEYFGLQAARRAQRQTAMTAQAGLRGLTGERLAAGQRRAALETARAAGTAFDTGFGQGAQRQMEARRAGISAMPTSAPDATSGYSSLLQSYNTAATRRRQAQQDIGGLFADVFSKDRSKPEERKPT
jgi:hypothetical protein